MTMRPIKRMKTSVRNIVTWTAVLALPGAMACDGAGVSIAKVEVWVYGQVTDASTGAPVEGASIHVQQLSTSSAELRTNDQGAYFVRGHMYCTLSCNEDMYVSAALGARRGTGVNRLIASDEQLAALRIDVEVGP